MEGREGKSLKELGMCVWVMSLRRVRFTSSREGVREIPGSRLSERWLGGCHGCTMARSHMTYSPDADYDSNPVAVAEFADVFEAHMAATALADAEIYCDVRPAMSMQYGPTGTATLYVLESRAADAQRVLAEVVPAGRAWIISAEETEGLGRRVPQQPSLTFAASHYLFFLVAAVFLFAHPTSTDADFYIGLIFGSLGLSVRGAYLLSVQRWRDYMAGQVLSGADHRPFSLFLRPFFVTNRLNVVRRLRQFFMSMILIRNDLDETVDFETLLRTAIDKDDQQLIGLGKPGEALGAGRVETGDDIWRETLTPLVDRAQEIYVIPGSQPGIVWELGLLRERNALKKSIFIMPPGFIAEKWQECIQVAATIGYRLPRYNRRGELFTIEDDGSLGAEARLGSLTAGAIRRALHRVRSLRDRT